MGLDQYAFRKDSNNEKTEICYWRKHNALQGWMESLWSIKTGKPSDDLNCNEVELDMSDLNQLKKCIQNQTLPETQGFFFGEDTSRDESRQEYDLKFVAEAQEVIKEGHKVFYTCWW